MASDNINCAVSLVLADLRWLGCELRPDAVKRLRRVLAEEPERRERARQSMAKGGRKSFEARHSAIAGVPCDREALGTTKSAEERKLLGGPRGTLPSKRGRGISGNMVGKAEGVFPGKPGDEPGVKLRRPRP
jgi:hypothetical protein